MAQQKFLLIDISNSFTKLSLASGKRIKKPWRVPTKDFRAEQLSSLIREFSPCAVIFSSVVPQKKKELENSLSIPNHWLGADSPLGIGIDYPKPNSIGSDRLANAVGCVVGYGYPAIVVDFGTAVTFDVLSMEGAYTGGVIAPGLSAMTHYLYEKTALLPQIKLSKPSRVVGKTTREAMLSGAIFGYRGLVREICSEINHEISPKKKIPWIATGGYAKMIGDETALFDKVDPHLTLRGMLYVAHQVFIAE